MKLDAPLNGEFMRESSPIFDWEAESMQKLEAWDAKWSGVEAASKASAEVIDKANGRDRPSRETLTDYPVKRDVANEGEAEVPQKAALPHEGTPSLIEQVLKKLAEER